MTRLLHIGLLLMALIGLIGQSTAMAMAPPAAASHDRTAMTAMAGMDYAGMSSPQAPDQPPCKKVTLQCMAAMGCSPLAFTQPLSQRSHTVRHNVIISAPGKVASLTGRDFGPEPDPPSLLI